ncbi:hypothetical protein [Ereboglobus luteus]|uniref:hypothetical protein n=1 Tax=Ereboglobus luteus TaxID=1796921 RepID=UPI001F28DE7E|nr:hypothetical protein [Ereboglobus luteus]
MKSRLQSNLKNALAAAAQTTGSPCPFTNEFHSLVFRRRKCQDGYRRYERHAPIVSDILPTAVFGARHSRRSFANRIGCSTSFNRKFLRFIPRILTGLFFPPSPQFSEKNPTTPATQRIAHEPPPLPPHFRSFRIAGFAIAGWTFFKEHINEINAGRLCSSAP